MVRVSWVRMEDRSGGLDWGQTSRGGEPADISSAMLGYCTAAGEGKVGEDRTRGLGRSWSG